MAKRIALAALVFSSLVIGYLTGFIQYGCNHVYSESGTWVECHLSNKPNL